MRLNPFDADLLQGFGELISFADLRSGRFGDIPRNLYGVYAVVCPSDAPPEFLERGTCGDFRGAPYSVLELRGRWISGTRILYLGKAGGPGIKETLRNRVLKYSSFGLGKNVPHGGGRAIWQIRGSESFQVCWKPTPDATPQDVETALRVRFRTHYGRLPFANWLE